MDNSPQSVKNVVKLAPLTTTPGTNLLFRIHDYSFGPPIGWQNYAGSRVVNRDAFPAPDGTQTADIVTGSSSFWQAVPLLIDSGNIPITWSVHIHESSTAPFLQLTTWYYNNDNSVVRQGFSSNFNPRTGILNFNSGTPAASGGSVYVGNGWYRYWSTTTVNPTLSPFPTTLVVPELYYNNTPVLTGNLVIWGHQLNIDTSPNTYFNTTDYGSVNIPEYQIGNLVNNGNNFTQIQDIQVNNVNIQANGKDPLNSNTGTNVLETASTEQHNVFINNIATASVTGPYTWTVYIRGLGRENLFLSPKINNVDYRTFFNCPLEGAGSWPLSAFVINNNNGTIVSVPAGNTAKIESINYNFYKLSVSRNVTAGDTIQFTLGACISGTERNYLGNSLSGFNAWGLKVSPGYFDNNDAIRINDSRETYLTYGVNDSNLLTYSEDFTKSNWSNFQGVKDVTPKSFYRPDRQFITASTITSTASILQDVLIDDTRGTYTFTCYAHISSQCPYIAPTIWLTKNIGGPITEIEAASAKYNVQTGAFEGWFPGYESVNKQTNSTFVGNGWYRYTVSMTGTLSGSRYARPEIYYNSGAPLSGSLILWGTQFEQKDTASPYIKTLNAPILSQEAQGRISLNAVEPNLKLPTTTTTTISGSTYYFPVISKSNKHIKSRRFTSNDTLIIKNSKLGYNNVNPTFTFDVSGSLGAVRATVPTISTTRLSQASGNNGSLNINTNLVNFNSNLTSTNLQTSILSARSIYTTNFTRVSTQTIIVPISSLSSISVNNLLFTGNFTTNGTLTANSITITDTSYTPYASAVNINTNLLNANNILLTDGINRVNLIDYSQVFDNSVWIKNNSSIVPNITSAPNGTQTADKLVESTQTGTASAQHLLHQSGNEGPTNNKTYTFSVFAKAAERTKIALTSYAQGYSVFDLAAGTVTATGGNTCTITASSNGWYRCATTITRTSTDDNSGYYDNFYILPWTTTNNYTGDGSSGVFIWGAQLEKGSTLTDYQRTTVNTITADNLYGRIKIKPEGNLTYNNLNQLTPSPALDNIYLGVKPSDSYSTDNTSIKRTATGQWDNNSTENHGTLKPYFQNIQAALNYAGTLKGNELVIYIYENIIAGERRINNNTPASGNRDGEYSGCFGNESLNATSRFYSTEWLGSNYPTLTAAGIRGGDFIWAKDSSALLTSMPTYWYVPESLNFKFVRIKGLSNVSSRIGTNFYAVNKPFDQAPVKVTHRTYACGNPALTAGQFGTDPNTWLITPYYAIYGRTMWSTGFNFETIYTNINFEIENNFTDNTSIWNNGGTLRLENITISLLGDGMYTYGAMFNGGNGNGTTASRTIICGVPQFDPYYITSNTSIWDSRVPMFPGYGLAIVGNPVTSSKHTRLAHGFFKFGSESTGSLTLYDNTVFSKPFGQNSYIQSSVIFDGKINGGYPDNSEFTTSFFYMRRGNKVETTNNYFKTNNFQLSTYETTWLAGTPRKVSHNKNNPSYTNFRHITIDNSYCNYLPFSFGLAPWKMDGTIPDLIPSKHNINIYHGVRNFNIDTYKYKVNTVTKSANLSGLLVPFGLPEDQIIQFNSMRPWGPDTSTTLENLISPNELPNFDTPGYFRLVSPLNPSLTSTMVFYASATR